MKFQNIAVSILFFLWLGAVVFFSLSNFRTYLPTEVSSAIKDGFYLHILAYFSGSALAWAAFGQRGRWPIVFLPLTTDRAKISHQATKKTIVELNCYLIVDPRTGTSGKVSNRIL